MKFYGRFFLGSATAFLFSLSAMASATQLRYSRSVGTQESIVTISSVHTPSGFDADSDVFVVASGVYPNGCYRWKEAKIEHDGKFQHNITAVANVSEGMCIMVLVPFTQEIRIGKLASGTHNLRFMGGDGTYFEKALTVE